MKRRLLSRPLLAAIALALVAAAAMQGTALHAKATGTYACGLVPAGTIYATGPGGIGSGTASAWTCQGDLLGVEPTSGGNKAAANGGAAVNTTFSSGTLAVPEECVTSTTPNTCGRGEFGYGGGELPFGSVLIDAQDTTQNPSGNDTFACSNNGSVATSTETGGSTSGQAPALAYHVGNFAGGTVSNGNGDAGTVSGDTQCYTPYEQCTSAPTGNTTVSPPVPNASFCSQANQSNSVPGKVYLGTEAPSAAVRELNAAFYVPDATGNGTACKGQIVIAGGLDSTGNTELSSAYVYDPRYKIGTTTNTNFDHWTSLSSSLGAARDSMAVVQLSATKWLLAGGETTSAASNEYDIFDATTCAFTSNTLPNARYDFGMAKFGGFGSDVLACGGTNNFTTFAGLTSCDLYNASTGTWTTQTSTLAVGRDGAFAQFLPSEGTTTPHILIAAHGDTGTTNSEECSENTSTHVATCDLTGSAISYDTTAADVGYDTTQAQAFEGISDSSHVLVGCIATEDVCDSAGYTTSSLDQFVFECGGFNASSGANGNDTIITCEYYVPSGSTIPTSIFGSTSTCQGSSHSPTTGPAWCTTAASHMNRERAYFSLFEFPALGGTPTGGTQATSDEFIACGGFYGEGTTKFTPYLVRKNCEGLTKGTH